MEATVLSCHFIWVWSCMPKVLWNNKSSISLERVYDFAEFIHVVTCILLDSHYSYRNMLFWVCTIRHRLWLSDFLNLKNSKTIWVTKLIFGYHWSYEKYHAVLVYGPLKFLVVFLFLTCLTCLFLVQGVHCYIALINNEYLLILVTDFALLNYYFQIIKLYKNPVKVHASYLK